MIVSHLDASKHGFRRYHSTLTQILVYLDAVYTGVNSILTNQAVYLVFTKAFDSINHVVLIMKLQKLGITGKTLNVIRSYLSNRKQLVDIDGYQFGCLCETSGVQ